MARNGAFFDMDRTLVRKDTSALYTRYRRDLGEATVKDALQVGWWALQYTLGVIDAPRVAVEALRSFRGKEERWLLDSCEGWFKDYVLQHIPAKAREVVQRHRESGDFIAIVTGATRYAAEPLGRELGIETVVCTRLEVDPAGCFTGLPIEPLCYGTGKLELARRVAAVEDVDFANSTFYSDSITDLPLLEAVGRPIVVNPDRRLRRVAQKRGWVVERW
ncbi:MAG TPA: HAD family hydrolase [Polyangiaceae bacterium]